ncbi:hypothetical protein F8388_006699 [Cannabis sativa]|nr:hypothetical protein F8388_006699 [Cannabis sativa]
MTSRVLYICNEEGLNLDSEALSTLSSISQGDLRRAITYLQFPMLSIVSSSLVWIFDFFQGPDWCFWGEICCLNLKFHKK